MGFEKYTLVDMRLYSPSNNRVIINSATFPPGPDSNGIQFPRALMERICVKLQVLDATDSETAIMAYMRSRSYPQSIKRGATYTEVNASEAYKSAGSGSRPWSTRMRSASSSATRNSKRGHRHQSRSSSDDIDDDRKPPAPTDVDSDDNTDVNTESGRLRVTYMRRRHGEREPRNRLTGDIRPLQPTLQQPRRGYSQIEWSEPEAMSTALPPRPTYVPPRPKDREEFERQNWMYIHNGRWGEWSGQYGMVHTFCSRCRREPV